MIFPSFNVKENKTKLINDKQSDLNLFFIFIFNLVSSPCEFYLLPFIFKLNYLKHMMRLKTNISCKIFLYI